MSESDIDGPVLTPDQVRHFIEHGYVRVEDCLPPEVTADWVVWCEQRLAALPPDYPPLQGMKSEIPSLISVDATELAPKAWRAARELVGGTDRVRGGWHFTDGFIVNHPRYPGAPWAPPAVESGMWHLDSYWFRCFLDSPEWALCAVVVWRDIAPTGGAMVVAPGTLPGITQWFAEHPEGHDAEGEEEGQKRMNFARYLRDHMAIVELTAKAGDVFFLSRNLLHAQSPNRLRADRIITRPSLTLNDPLCLDREDGRYSPLEQQILHALGVERLPFHPSRTRSVRPSPASQMEHNAKRRRLLDLFRERGGSVADSLISNHS